MDQGGAIQMLSDCFKSRRSRNSRYSLRAFARDLGVSHSYLSRLFSGKRTLSLKQAFRVAEILELDGETKLRFLSAIAKADSTD